MKLRFILILLLSTATLNAQNFNNASEYLDFIGEQQEGISKKMWTYTKAIAHSKNDRTIENKRQNLVKTVDRVIGKIKKAGHYNGEEFKNQLLKKLQFNKDLLNDDYAKIIDMKAVAEQSYDAMEAYMLAQELADKKMEESEALYETQFYAYANANNINIVESESDLSVKIKNSNEVFAYYKKLYLIYFKVFINEIYLTDAINNSDIGAIEQNASALNESAKEGLEILKNIEDFKGDKSLITATQNTFNFFIEETETYTPQMTDFLTLNKDFEKIQTTLDKTPERKRTKEQIDAFNKKVKELNKGVKNYNNNNVKVNTERQKVVNALEQANQNFLGRHIPND